MDKSLNYEINVVEKMTNIWEQCEKVSGELLAMVAPPQEEKKMDLILQSNQPDAEVQEEIKLGNIEETYEHSDYQQQPPQFNDESD